MFQILQQKCAPFKRREDRNPNAYTNRTRAMKEVKELGFVWDEKNKLYAEPNRPLNLGNNGNINMNRNEAVIAPVFFEHVKSTKHNLFLDCIALFLQYGAGKH